MRCNICGEEAEASPYIPGDWMHADDSHPHDHFASVTDSQDGGWLCPDPECSASYNERHAAHCAESRPITYVLPA